MENPDKKIRKAEFLGKVGAVAFTAGVFLMILRTINSVVFSSQEMPTGFDTTMLEELVFGGIIWVRYSLEALILKSLPPPSQEEAPPTNKKRFWPFKPEGL